MSSRDLGSVDILTICYGRFAFACRANIQSRRTVEHVSCGPRCMVRVVKHIYMSIYTHYNTEQDIESEQHVVETCDGARGWMCVRVCVSLGRMNAAIYAKQAKPLVELHRIM